MPIDSARDFILSHLNQLQLRQPEPVESEAFILPSEAMPDHGFGFRITAGFDDVKKGSPIPGGWHEQHVPAR